ncbi:hypothetical protein KI387_042365 [Taxus chinensis]|uniref:Trichome birefringence-like N-terminal domain-containing protein n=1 Tax=Taxus chinensis TaxID=29808 RepID=A0AA38F7E5_TAXCH|nr:hypothetical protein KI387_042365 [Taxus chinensis]
MGMSVWKLVQVAANNRFVSLLIVATSLSLIIFCSYLPSSSDQDEGGQNSGIHDLIPPSLNTSELLAGWNSNVSMEFNTSQLNESFSQEEASLVVEGIKETPVQMTQSSPQCDIYSGKWVYDGSYPLYPAGECPYMTGDFNCKGNGRQDSDYTKWRWQPTHCNLPRLNATDMLERLRGKRMMFIGDSLNRNQWESLLCILSTVVPQDRKYFGRSKDGGATSFVAQDYNCSVEFFWAPFLVEQDSINVGNKSKAILRLDAIEKHGAYWRDADILVFNSAHWWTHGNKEDSRYFYMEGDYLHPQLDPLVAFKRGLTTWASWIDQMIDPTKTRVFFRGFSPTHFSSRQWNKPKGYKCNFETQPILEESFTNPYPDRMKMVEEVLRKMKFHVSLLNITTISDFRKDAHPSVYTLRGKKKLTQEQRNNPDKFGDCSHWCLPGLPDIWNELLYNYLLTLTQTYGCDFPSYVTGEKNII